LKQFLDHIPSYLNHLLDLEIPPSDMNCTTCGKPDSKYRCLDCYGSHLWCKACIVKCHGHHPFHRPQCWKEGSFESIKLSDLGYVFRLGHAISGSSCSSCPDDGNSLGDRRMIVVHVNGVFELFIRFCRCQGAISEHEQLFRQRLFPSTFERPETAFTLDVLDYYGIDAMECKTSGQSFFHKLRRVTNNAFPDRVPVSSYYFHFKELLINIHLKNRYVELIRVSRQMRKLQVSKRFGEIYQDSSPPGSLAIFCPACPQPGINLPPNWKELPSWVTRRTIVVDGNFHADHIKMRRPDQDIMFTNGQGYMVEENRYKEYLSFAKEPSLVSWDVID
jgi:hypothetical protein